MNMMPYTPITPATPIPPGDATVCEFKSRRPTSPQGDRCFTVKSPGGILSDAECGSTVSFRRSPTHKPEKGIVSSRQFYTKIIEIVDMGGKPLRLHPHQYTVITHPAEVAPLSTHGLADLCIAPPAMCRPSNNGAAMVALGTIAVAAWGLGIWAAIT